VSFHNDKYRDINKVSPPLKSTPINRVKRIPFTQPGILDHKVRTDIKVCLNGHHTWLDLRSADSEIIEFLACSLPVITDDSTKCCVVGELGIFNDAVAQVVAFKTVDNYGYRAIGFAG